MNYPVAIYAVTIEHSRFLFYNKADAMRLVLAMNEAMGTISSWTTPKEGEPLIFEEIKAIPGIDRLEPDGMITKSAAEAGETESAKVAKLRAQVEKAESELHTAKWTADNAKRKAEEHELNACRLAGILEANGLTAEGAADKDE